MNTNNQPNRNILPAHFFLNSHNYERYLNKIHGTPIKAAITQANTLPPVPTKITYWDLQIKIFRKDKQRKYFKGIIQEARTIAEQHGKKIEDVEFTINEHGIVTHLINP